MKTNRWIIFMIMAMIVGTVNVMADNSTYVLYDSCTSDSVATNFESRTRTPFEFNSNSYWGMRNPDMQLYLAQRIHTGENITGVKFDSLSNSVAPQPAYSRVAIGDYDALGSWYGFDDGYVLRTLVSNYYGGTSQSFALLQVVDGVETEIDSQATSYGGSWINTEMRVDNNRIIVKVNNTTMFNFTNSIYTPSTKTVYVFSAGSTEWTTYGCSFRLNNIYDLIITTTTSTTTTSTTTSTTTTTTLAPVNETTTTTTTLAPVNETTTTTIRTSGGGGGGWPDETTTTVPNNNAPLLAISPTDTFSFKDWLLNFWDKILALFKR